MTWQMYWPNWWRLWPHHTQNDDDLIVHHTFCFGPFQARWYGVRR